MTKEEAKEKFGDNIINELLSLGAEPTNVCRNDDIVEWCSDGCIKVGDIEVWAYYYFYEGENPDLCNWEDRMEIEVRVRTFEGGCCSEYILTSRKPRKNNRRELVNNPENQLLGFDTVRETVFGMEKELSIDESVNVKFDYEII